MKYNEHVRVFSQISSLPYDERPLPVFRKRLSDQPVKELDKMPPLTDTSSPRSPESSGQPEPLTEKAQREASLPIEIYGDCLVRRTCTGSNRLIFISFFFFFYKAGLND